MKATQQEYNKAQEEFQTMPTDLIIKIISGELDPQKLASEQLANRGLNHDGEWVGFPKAKEISKKWLAA